MTEFPFSGNYPYKLSAIVMSIDIAPLHFQATHSVPYDHKLLSYDVFAHLPYSLLLVNLHTSTDVT